MARLFLASTSPRRRELLTQIGVPFEIVAAAIDESLRPNESAEEYVQRLAREKAAAGFAALHEADVWVLGADTSVVLDGQVLGKPADKADGLRMLAELSAREHQVLTAVALQGATGTEVRVVSSQVRFRQISKAEALAYWESGEPQDKAGGYGIQGWGAVFVEQLTGSYSAVVGLPLCETAQLLDEKALARWCKAAN